MTTTPKTQPQKPAQKMKPKILLLTQMHQRPAISELFCMSALRLQEASRQKFDITIVSLVSDAPSEAVCRKYSIDMIFTCAGPLGKKMNTGITLLLKNYQFDYLLKIDDDDIVSSNLLEVYTPFIKKGVPLFGVKQVYFLDAANNQALFYKYPYTVAKLMGCGKMISRTALERTGWQSTIKPKNNYKHLGVQFYADRPITIPHYQAHYMVEMKYADMVSSPKFNLFNDEQTMGLDFVSEMNFVFNGYDPVEVVTEKPLFTDVKTNVNIWKFADYATVGKHVPVSEATAHWSIQEREYLLQLQAQLK